MSDQRDSIPAGAVGAATAACVRPPRLATGAEPGTPSDARPRPHAAGTEAALRLTWEEAHQAAGLAHATGMPLLRAARIVRERERGAGGGDGDGDGEPGARPPTGLSTVRRSFSAPRPVRPRGSVRRPQGAGDAPHAGRADRGGGGAGEAKSRLGEFVAGPRYRPGALPPAGSSPSPFVRIDNEGRKARGHVRWKIARRAPASEAELTRDHGGRPVKTPNREGQRLEQLAAEARYHRRRLDLYRTRLYSGRVLSVAPLEEFRRAADAAADRLDEARGSARARHSP